MNLWSILGVSPQAGIAGASVGMLIALVVAITTIWRTAHRRPSSALGLFDR